MLNYKYLISFKKLFQLSSFFGLYILFGCLGPKSSDPDDSKSVETLTGEETPKWIQLFARGNNTCAFKNGTLKCWGYDYKHANIFNDPTDDSLDIVDLNGLTPTQINAGYDKTCVILSDDSLRCWGKGKDGALGQGNENNIGDNFSQMGVNLPFIDLGTGLRATQVAIGANHICALLNNATIKCWGDGWVGQLGSGNQNDRGDTPNEMGNNFNSVNLGSGITATQVVAGFRHTCALLDNGTVKCWGNNSEGRLGLGDTDNRGDNSNEMGGNLPAIDLGTGIEAIQIVAGVSYTCALLDNGTVKCWGENNVGQLGQGDTENRGDGSDEMGNYLLPINLGTGRTATQIAAGKQYACALLDNETVKCWGENNVGQLGQGDTENRGDDSDEMGNYLPAIDLGTGRRAIQISMGYDHACALLDNGTVKCWGENDVGQLGQGHTNHLGDEPNEMGDNLPIVTLGANRTVTQLATGRDHVCVLLDDASASMKCWGGNSEGQLGQENTDDLGDAYTEMGYDLAALSSQYNHIGDTSGDMGENLATISSYETTSIVSASVGNLHSCIRLSDGEIKCWGMNDNGQLGQGNKAFAEDASLPLINLGLFVSVKEVVASNSYTCALLDDNTVTCWGDNTYGQLGQDYTSDAIAPIVNIIGFVDTIDLGEKVKELALGGGHTCALLENKSIKCWGKNYDGQLGQGHRNNIGDNSNEMINLNSIDLGTDRTAKQVIAGESHTCALLDNDNVKCWGDNTYGQLGLQDQESRGNEPDEMGEHLSAITLGSGLKAKKIATGKYHTCALLDNSTVKCWGDNTYGQLGQGDQNPRGDDGDMGDSLETIKLTTDSDITVYQIVAGDYHTCVVLSDESVKCWGRNTYGQLGLQDQESRGNEPDEMEDDLPTLELGNF